MIDTSTVTPTPTGFTPTGSVTYTFFPTVACTDTGTAAGGGALVGGAPPNSNTQGPLAAGSYGFQATYSGDANYAGSTSTCEPLTVSTGHLGHGHDGDRRGHQPAAPPVTRPSACTAR